MRKKITTVFLVLTVLVAAPVNARDVGAWNTAGNVGRDVLVGFALGLPAVRGDWEGDLQAAGSIGSAFLATEALKRAFPETRPDLSDRRSFPSGHTSSAFAAAATIQNRYGWKLGVPAQFVAVFVGLSRVEARKHHWYDVVVGAAIGEASGFLITSKRNSDIRVLPWGDSHGGGAAVALKF